MRAKKDGKKSGGGRSSMLLPAAVIAVGLLGGGFLFGAKSSTPAAAAPAPLLEEVEDDHGPIAPLEPITLHLAGGQYLKLGMAPQFAAPEEEEGGGEHVAAEELPQGATAKASDVAIDLFSRHSMEELNDPAARAVVKEELVNLVREAYHDEVTDVYFTEFVMQ